MKGHGLGYMIVIEKLLHLRRLDDLGGNLGLTGKEAQWHGKQQQQLPHSFNVI
jgi:hypothetical protein